MSALPGLRRCPFCGGRAQLEQMGWPHHVYCTRCGAKSVSARYAADGAWEAIQKWNQRALDVIRCRDWWGEMSGVPMLAASDVPSCMRWGGGCMTNEDGFCFLAQPKDDDGMS